MTLNPEFKNLCERWREKAKNYKKEELPELFDKFFSLYVVYNALYGETAAYLSRKAKANGTNDHKLEGDTFPDDKAATQYVISFLTSRGLLQSLEANESTKEAINQIKMLIGKDNNFRFRICVHPVSGEHLPNEDNELSQSLNSDDNGKKAKAILKLIYRTRCNMFHGRKGFEPVQRELLVSLSIILEKIVDQLYRKLDSSEHY